MDEYKIANLSPEDMSILTDIEKKIQQVSDQEVVLIAYQKENKIEG